jgi:Na+-driven multidrug efflux pump
VTSLIVTGFAARIGPEVLAGYGIGARLELLMVPLIFGVGGAAIAVGGAATGAGLRDRAIRVGWTAAALSSAIVGSLGVVLALAAGGWAPAFTDDPAIAVTIVAYIERVGPFYVFFALGLTLYFASQGLDTLFWPVFGTVVRLAVIVAGGAALFAGETTPEPASLFWLVAVAMTTYGLFNAVALAVGPWRRPRPPVSA